MLINFLEPIKHSTLHILSQITITISKKLTFKYVINWAIPAPVLLPFDFKSRSSIFIAYLFHIINVKCYQLLILTPIFVSVSYLYNVSQKKSPCSFLKFFPKRLGIFNQFFAHLLRDHFYTRVQIFIQISPTLTKLCHTKRNHLAKFYISLEL